MGSLQRDFEEKDCSGRTAIQTALSHPETHGDIILEILRKTPAAASKVNAAKDLILHQALKGGKRPLGYFTNEVFFIGCIVQEFPKALTVQDESSGMYPFVLASAKGWSLD